ncbi:MAG: GGDEF domain-containing protein [Candidatus Calescibacterium sp.]|nr:GGDEF domain-containing protein [Candidatus Calescibacterium sp.]MCX7734014.1 GGDEF domain-containing protein [bacterium]MDW8086387.1 GGDEF domain-containing protein [Candidatus Calescibacterium sp.]
MPVHEITDATDITQIKKEDKDSERVAVLVVESPPDLIGREFLADSVGIIGRSSNANIVIPEKSVSRKHAFYEFDPRLQKIFIKDLNSTNSTFVNGKKITSAYVNAGDRISLGKVVLRFDLRTRAEQNLREKIKKQAVYDLLTGILNRSALEQEIKKLIMNSENFCLIFIDLDNFKQINDTFGHQKGDELLKSFSSILKNSIRETDIAGRYGGDEIVLVLRKINSNIAKDIMNRIRENFRKHFSEYEKIGFNFSYGVSEFPKDAETMEELIMRADQRLYEDKKRRKK